MMIVLFTVGDSAYGIDIAPVREIIPCVPLQVVPHAPPMLAGMLNYHGTMAPVLDLSQILAGRASEVLLSTRILIVEHDDAGSRRLMGLMGEGVTETVSYQASDVRPLNVAIEGAPYLGGFITDEFGDIQLIDLGGFIDTTMSDILRERS